MLSYRHAFHAGNKADIFKHSILTLLIAHFKQKDTPFTYVDTHAGCGVYNLQSEWAQKTGEAKDGIITFLQTATKDKGPSVMHSYIDICNDMIKHNEYPGSPEIARLMARKQDSLIVSELQKADYDDLNYIMKKDKRVHVHNRNGFEMLHALPFPQRTLLLIDPSYETDSDYSLVVEAVTKFYKRNSTAIIAVWYPLVNRRESKTESLKNSLQSLAPIEEKFSVIEHIFTEIHAENYGMYGSGLAILNPPWLFTEHSKEVLYWLSDCMG